jgi:Zn-dependent oligopeptidase
VVTWAGSASLRERLWRLQRQRAHPANLEVLSRMLSRRAELARLLGHPTWAAYATEDKMIGGEAQAAAFVEKIADAAGARMRRDHEELLARKRMDACVRKRTSVYAPPAAGCAATARPSTLHAAARSTRWASGWCWASWRG